jgi:hypothetical protein
VTSVADPVNGAASFMMRSAPGGGSDVSRTAACGFAPCLSSHDENHSDWPSGANVNPCGPSGETLATALRSLSGTSPIAIGAPPSVGHSSTL